MKIYLDNAATSYPKPKSVYSAVKSALYGFYGNAGRSGHTAAMNSTELILSAREAAASLFFASPENVFFTYNATYALNAAILGTAVRFEKASVLTTNLEHNSVLRPLYSLEDKGKISLTVLDVPESDEELLSALRQSTRFFDIAVMTAVSNVTGRRLPIDKIGRIMRSRGTFFIVDAAQAVGNMSLDIRCADVICAPAHKGLFGLMGSGFAVVNGDSPFPEPIISGGSGTASLQRTMPPSLPDRFEAGTGAPLCAAALTEGIAFVKKQTCKAIFEHEKSLCALLYGRLYEMNGISIYSKLDSGILLFNMQKKDSHEIERELSKRGICVRGGLHCAPLIHKKLNTEKSGAVRVSFGAFNTKKDVDAITDALFYMTKR